MKQKKILERIKFERAIMHSFSLENRDLGFPAQMTSTNLVLDLGKTKSVPTDSKHPFHPILKVR